MQSFAHNKSSSISQLIKGKSRDLQNLLRFLSEIVTSTYMVGTGSRAGCKESSSFPGCEI